MSRSPGKYVDLAEMSQSGTLQPSVPVQVLLKYNPPTLTIVYHFEHQDNDQYFHNIPMDLAMIEKEETEEIVNHLYFQESYYFNPKILKRNQVKRLVEKLKAKAGAFSDVDRSPERHSIHSQSQYQGSGSASPMRHQGAIMQGQLQHDRSSSQNQAQHHTSAGFLGGNIDGLNIHQRRSPPRTSQSNQNQQRNPTDAPTSQPALQNHNANFQKNRSQNQDKNSQQNSSSFQQMQQQSAFQRRKSFFERKRLLNVQAHNPMEFQNLTDPPAAATSDIKKPTRGRQQNHLQGASQGSNSGSPPPNTVGTAFQQQENVQMAYQQTPQLRSSLAGGRSKLPPLESPDQMHAMAAVQPKSSLNQANQRKPNRAQHLANAMHERMPIDGNGPSSYPGVGTVPPSAPSVSQQSSAISGKQNAMHFPQNSPVQANHAMQAQMNIYDNQQQQQQMQQQQPYQQQYQQQEQEYPYQNHQGISGGGQELLADGDESSANNNYGQEVMNQSNQNQSMNGEEHLSVYMKDNNVVMRRIQIEGDERDFLMDPDGNIFDMQGTFIGTANTNELEELNEDSQNQQNDMNNQQVSNQPQEEMMLLDDDDDVVTNANENTPGLPMHQNKLGFAGQASADGVTMDMDMELGSAGSQGDNSMVYGGGGYQQHQPQNNIAGHKAYVQ